MNFGYQVGPLCIYDALLHVSKNEGGASCGYEDPFPRIVPLYYAQVEGHQWYRPTSSVCPPNHTDPREKLPGSLPHRIDGSKLVNSSTHFPAMIVYAALLFTHVRAAS